MEFWLGAKRERCSSVFRQLRNRGITGVFVAPLSPADPEPRIQLPKQGFQIVTFGPEHLFPDHHTVQFDFYEDLRLAWKRLWDQGYRKIGLIHWDFHGWRTGHAWQGAFYVEQTLAGIQPENSKPLVVGGKTLSDRKARYLNWLEQGHHDAVISSYGRVLEWNEELAHAPEVALLTAGQSNAQGIDLNMPHMGNIAVELLYMDMQNSLTNRRGPPFRVHVPGKWVDTITLV